MSGCHVIKGNDKPCGNYALKGKTCCFSHRKLEDTPYTEKDGEIKKSVLRESDQCIFICKTGKRCSRGFNYQHKMCSQHKAITDFQKGLKPAPTESESDTKLKSETDSDYDGRVYDRKVRAYNGRASGSESDCDDRAYDWFSRAYSGSESESEPDDYSKDPSYKCSSRSYNRRT
jgi:hypothetical protein